MENIESITGNFSRNNEQLTNIIKNFSSLSDTLIKANISSVVTNAAQAVESTTALMEKINKGEGSLGLLINNDELYTNLEKASNNMDQLMEDIRLNPKRYVSFSIIERKDKNLKLSDKELKQLKELLKKE
jgi:phospholipid/cholesterol/gamma-HCH transport system substrate-binding protein